MAPKKDKREEARLAVEESLIVQAEADDRETRRLIIERKLTASAAADDQAIEVEIARREAAEAARREAARLRKIAEMAAARTRIEKRIEKAARAEDAAEEVRRAALLAAQEAADISALAPTLSDASYIEARQLLTKEWEQLHPLYSHWGAQTVTPGQLLTGYRMVKTAQPSEVDTLRTYLSQLANGQLAEARTEAIAHSPAAADLRTNHGEAMVEHVRTAAGQREAEAEMRLLTKCLQPGGYSDRALASEPAVVGTLTGAAARRPAPKVVPPHAIVKQPFAPPARARPPALGQTPPAWRQAPAATVGARRRQTSHSMRACRFDARFSNWAGGKYTAVTANSVVEVAALEQAPAATQVPRTLAEVKALHDPRRPQSAQYGRQARALTHVGGEQQRALPRPSSAPPKHAGISPRMQSELRNIVTAVR